MSVKDKKTIPHFMGTKMNLTLKTRVFIGFLKTFLLHCQNENCCYFPLKHQDKGFSITGSYVSARTLKIKYQEKFRIMRAFITASSKGTLPCLISISFCRVFKSFFLYCVNLIHDYNNELNF